MAETIIKIVGTQISQLHRTCGSSSKKKSKLFYTADGNKMFPSMRPWMISH